MTTSYQRNMRAGLALALAGGVALGAASLALRPLPDAVPVDPCAAIDWPDPDTLDVARLTPAMLTVRTRGDLIVIGYADQEDSPLYRFAECVR